MTAGAVFPAYYYIFVLDSSNHISECIPAYSAAACAATFFYMNLSFPTTGHERCKRMP
jgi:hypothetical protein